LILDNNKFKLFLQDKQPFNLSEETKHRLNFYSQDFPINEINYDLNGKIYTSHEGLLLKYEECFVRKFDEKYFDLSSHFLWIGKFFI
jgi:3-deoxy-7-phosphoheptulonate synthase